MRNYAALNSLDYNLRFCTKVTFCNHVKGKTTHTFPLGVSLYFLFSVLVIENTHPP